MNFTGLENYILIWVIITGLCLGSFYNVVIFRSLSDESIIYPPSKCPKCGNKLKPWHNIPILSYIFLRGKCAFCKEKISIQYPLVEFLTGLLFGGIFIKFGMSWTTLFGIFWISCLIIMTATDLKEKVVDCNIAIAMGISGLIFSFINSGWIGAKDSLFGALIGILIIEAVALIGKLFKKGRAMGEADTYVAGAFGAIAGWHDIGLILIYSLIASMLFILPAFWYERYKAKDSLTIFFSALFVFSISLFILFNGVYWTIILLIIAGLLLSYTVIKSMKAEDKKTCLPFVPALSLGFLYFLMFVL